MQVMTGDGSGGAGADTVTLARASRGARIGTRAGRMARVIRLIRLVRVVKLYKSANQAMVNKEGAMYEENKNKLNELKAMKKAGGSNTAGPDQDINLKEMLLNDQMESKVGKKLSEITTRRVIILVLIMLFSQPLFAVSTYMQEPNSYDYGLILIKELGPTKEGGILAFNSMITVQSKINTPLVYLYIYDDSAEEIAELEYTKKGFDQNTYRKSEMA
jgi:hypothetical protein